MEGLFLMLPIQIQGMRDQLLHWGYSRYNVQRMQPWDLLGFYHLEKDQPHHVFLPVGSSNIESVSPSELSASPRYIDVKV